jgi:hypothetical protein
MIIFRQAECVLDPTRLKPVAKNWQEIQEGNCEEIKGKGKDRGG